MRPALFVPPPSLLRGRDMPHDAVRFLAASAGGMRCRHYNCGEGTGCRYLQPRHPMAPAGAAAPQSRTLFRGEDCLSAASSAALTVGTGAKALNGSRPGAHGLGSFCRNKRTASCGAETPQKLLCFCDPEQRKGSRIFSRCLCLSSPRTPACFPAFFLSVMPESF